ncbi:MAG: L,D-transpeptidase family protein [Candidatus Paceibacterota bacterium]|jgi:lipoprotein-anchoring transpeptidase ErfK/SrfK
MTKISSIFIILSVAISGFLFYLELNRATAPEYANYYAAFPISCSYREGIGTEIKFDFTPGDKAKNKIPQYDIQYLPEQGKTKIVFHNVGSVENNFYYDEIAGNPLFSNLDYSFEGANLAVEIEREGAYLPAEIIKEKSDIVIFLKAGDQNYPTITEQKPADNSAVFPSFKEISFKAELKSPLKKAIILFQNNPMDISAEAISTSSNQYLFKFKTKIEKDKEYRLKAIVTDSQDRTSIASWSFAGQVLVETILGKDRFKYLGWWGQINADNITVRKDPNASSTQVGSFSSANRVKILKEISGQEIGDTNIWYEIDGGKYPHAYVFSRLVTPLPQPQPPEKLSIPEEVQKGDYWIDVDITKKVLTLFNYDKPVFATYISPGREENPTPTGTFKVWYKLRKATMKGGPPLVKEKYDLKNVPSVMYYENSYAIHGAYWGDKFGTPQSAGCTNVTQGDAAFIFEKTKPTLAPDKNALFSNKDNPGTVVYNHE